MKNETWVILLSLSLLFFSQCTSRDASVREINRNLDSIDMIFKKPNPDSAKIFVLTRSIHAFVNKYPNDAMSPKYLLALGMTYQKAGMYMQAVSGFQQLQNKYPSDSSCSKALFYEAFLYANAVNRMDSAQTLYQLYLIKYKNRDASTTKIVEAELKYLGKSPAEILNDIKKDSDKKK